MGKGLFISYFKYSRIYFGLRDFFGVFKKVRFSWIIKQLFYDLIGKDSFRGVTLTYTLLANQFGHFSLGFIPVIFFHACWPDVAILKFGLLIGGIWTVFEIGNVWGPINAGREASKTYYFNKERSGFRNPWETLLIDLLTDMLFFYSGSAWAVLALQEESKSGFCFATYTITILAIVFLTGWYAIKLCMQYGRRPFQFRLCQWEGKINSEDVNTAYEYLAYSYEQGRHLIVSGDSKSDKSKLGIAIATELSIKGCLSTYLTMVKLVDKLYVKDALSKFNDHPQKNSWLKKLFDWISSVTKSPRFWKWDNCDFLLIDDINPSSKGSPIHVSAKQFQGIIENATYGSEFKTRMTSQSIIWVLDTDSIIEWEEMLREIGVDKIAKISL